MTKIQAEFGFERPLDERMMARLAEVPSLYGILRLQLNPALDSVTVEYDATRLEEQDVEAALARAGIPAVAGK